MRHMHDKRFAVAALALALLCVWQPAAAGPARQDSAPSGTPSVALPNPADLIVEVNNMRLSDSLPILTIHPALMRIAQRVADGLAADPSAGLYRPYGLSLGQWMIMEGFPLSGDITLDGYRSENWSMVVSAPGAVEQIHYWVSSGDEEHTNTMLSDMRSDIGMGVASSKDEYGQDQIYFVIETALRTGTGQQQSEARDFLTSLPALIHGTQSVDGTPIALGEGQYIIPVRVNTARPDGDVFHKVRSGQTLWSIAIYYHTSIEQIRQLNGLGPENTVYEGQNLLVRKGATQPAITSTVTLTPAISPTLRATASFTPTPLAVTPQAPSAGGNLPAVLGVVLLAFCVLAGIIAASMKSQN